MNRRRGSGAMPAGETGAVGRVDAVHHLALAGPWRQSGCFLSGEPRSGQPLDRLHRAATSLPRVVGGVSHHPGLLAGESLGAALAHLQSRRQGRVVPLLGCRVHLFQAAVTGVSAGEARYVFPPRFLACCQNHHRAVAVPLPTHYDFRTWAVGVLKVRAGIDFAYAWTQCIVAGGIGTRRFMATTNATAGMAWTFFITPIKL